MIGCPLKVSNIDGEEYLLDVSTGELFDYGVEPEYELFTNDKLIEYRQPCKRSVIESRDLEELIERCQATEHDKHSGYPVDRSGKLFDLMAGSIGAEINANLVRRTMQLALSIQRRNVFLSSIDELSNLLEIRPDNLSRELKKLQCCGLLRVHCPRGLKHTTRLLEFNPAFFWKGDYGVRIEAEKAWLDKASW